jgi:hypothetical protein
MMPFAYQIHEGDYAWAADVHGQIRQHRQLCQMPSTPKFDAGLDPQDGHCPTVGCGYRRARAMRHHPSQTIRTDWKAEPHSVGFTFTILLILV